MSPSDLSLFSSRFEMVDDVQSRLALTALAAAPELAVPLFLPMVTRELLGAGAMVRRRKR
jgi:hypothetical protein